MCSVPCWVKMLVAQVSWARVDLKLSPTQLNHLNPPSSPAAAIKEERSGLQRALHTKLDDHYPSKENQLLPNKIKFRSKLNMKDYVRVLVEDADTANGRWWMSCQVAVVPHTLHRACTPWPIKITSPDNAKQNCGWINWVDITDPCLDHPWAIFFEGFERYGHDIEPILWNVHDIRYFSRA